MATKKFNQMTTKKLVALMATASDEDKAAIQEVLDAREQAAATDNEDEALTPEQEAAIAEAEKNGGINPMYNGSKSTQEKKPKLSNEELHELSESLRGNIGHRCQVVPFGTIEWTDGYIAGIMEEKRSGKILYAIKLEDGRRIVKVHDSNLLKVLEETVEIHRAPRTRAEKLERTPEMAAAEFNEALSNVGKPVMVGDIKGRIVLILDEKRAQKVFYRIEIPAPTEENPNATKITHKVVGSSAVVLEEFDAEGTELNTKYRERLAGAKSRKSITPQDRVILCEENVKKLEEKLQKVMAELETKKQQLEDAKSELQSYLATQAEPTSEETEDLA